MFSSTLSLSERDKVNLVFPFLDVLYLSFSYTLITLVCMEWGRHFWN